MDEEDGGNDLALWSGKIGEESDLVAQVPEEGGLVVVVGLNPSLLNKHVGTILDLAKMLGIGLRKIC